MSHRHGYKGRKFGRETDQRRALIKGLASSLIDHTSIKTTHAKAKELVPYVEKLVTKAKKGDLHNRRQVISKVATVSSAHKLVDEIAPKLGARNSGYLRITKEGNRRGDNAPMSRVSFVDDLTEAPVAKASVAKAEIAAPKVEAKKPAAPKSSAKSPKTTGSKVQKTPVKKVGKK
ncbi:50S ribosomal protein L17 [Candidatus Saccharibacteria bacterium]|nr:50S ribosomal protein L17 [Candidatus Saccharibacteria bacterium]